MLRKLKHPNVIEFFDYGEIATGEVRVLFIRIQRPYCRPIASYSDVLA